MKDAEALKQELFTKNRAILEKRFLANKKSKMSGFFSRFALEYLTKLDLIYLICEQEFGFTTGQKDD